MRLLPVGCQEQRGHGVCAVNLRMALYGKNPSPVIHNALFLFLFFGLFFLFFFFCLFRASRVAYGGSKAGVKLDP